MRDKLTRELYWLLATAILTGVIGLWIFGAHIFDPTPADIQLHDSYYVFPKAFLLIAVFVALLSGAYLSRGIYFKLHNKILNGILTLLSFIVFVGLMIYLYSVSEFESHLRAVYSGEMDKNVQADVLSSFRATKGTVWTLLIITAAILMTTGYKILKPRRVG